MRYNDTILVLDQCLLTLTLQTLRVLRLPIYLDPCDHYCSGMRLDFVGSVR